MGLTPLTHPRAMANPAEAWTFYRALGCKEINIKDLRPSTPGELAALVRAMTQTTGMMDSLSFLGGRMTDAAWAAVPPLAASGSGYFDTRTTRANLRVWPDKAWCHAMLPPGGLEEASHNLGIALEPGVKTKVGNIEIAVGEGHYRLILESPRALDVTGYYRALAGDHHDRGHISNIAPASVEPLLAFLAGLGAQVDGGVTIPLDAAYQLATSFTNPTGKWWGNEVGIEFPGGRIIGYTKTYQGQPPIDAWFAKVDAALASAGLP